MVTSQGASWIACVEHPLFRIVGARLGNADMAHLALLLELHESGRQDIAMMLVGRRRDGVEMEDVHVVEAQPLQRRLHPAGHRFGCVAHRLEYGFGRDHQPVPVITPGGGAYDLLGSIGLGGVEEIDAEIDRRTHDRHAVVEAGAAAQAQAACLGEGCLGLGRGASVDDCVAIVRTAVDLGVNFLDTAEAYGTEEIVGAAARSYDRDKLVISTKAIFSRAIPPRP